MGTAEIRFVHLCGAQGGLPFINAGCVSRKKLEYVKLSASTADTVGQETAQEIRRMATDVRLKEQLPELTDRIVESYLETAATHHLGHCPLPHIDAIIQIGQDVKEILFPGYRRRENLHMGNVMYHVGNLIDDLHDRLTVQICRALRHAYDVEHGVQCEEKKHIDFEAEGQKKAIAFLESLPDMRKLLSTDAQAALDGDPAARSLDEIIFCYPGFEAVTIHRMAHRLYELEVPLIPRILAECSHSRTGIDIHPGANIGPSFFIDHGTGVVIGETCDIAAGVKVYQGVTLGALSFPKDENGEIIRGQKRHPTIEDNVIIGAGAQILGPVTVGRCARIGGNSVVTRDVS